MKKTRQEIKKILVVEDERPMADALQLKLTRAGFKTTAAYDGKTAIDMLKKSKFDLLILDLIMPRIDGFAVLHKLREKESAIPVIVLSNLNQEDDIARAKSLGALEYFVKTDTPLNYIVDRTNHILHGN